MSFLLQEFAHKASDGRKRAAKVRGLKSFPSAISVTNCKSVQSRSDIFEDVNIWKTHFYTGWSIFLTLRNNKTKPGVRHSQQKVTMQEKKREWGTSTFIDLSLEESRGELCQKTIKSKTHPLSGSWADVKHTTYRTNRSSAFTPCAFLASPVWCSCRPALPFHLLAYLF